jgi:single-strand DNA-binding protein
MSDVNNVVLVGRLTRDAELKYTANGKAVCKFCLAVNEKRKVGDRMEDAATFIDVVLWGQLGETLHEYLSKGRQIATTGKLTQDRWEYEDRSYSKIVVTASTVQLLGGTSGKDGGSARKPDDSTTRPPAASAGNGSDDYDIPF